MPSTILGWVKLILALALAGAFAFLLYLHHADKTTIAAKVQLLTLAQTQADLDAATIAQLRTDISTQSTLVGQLGATTVVAFKAAAAAEASAVQVTLPIAAEKLVLTKKAAAPAAASATCEQAIDEWRKRQ